MGIIHATLRNTFVFACLSFGSTSSRRNQHSSLLSAFVPHTWGMWIKISFVDSVLQADAQMSPYSFCLFLFQCLFHSSQRLSLNVSILLVSAVCTCLPPPRRACCWLHQEKGHPIAPYLHVSSLCFKKSSSFFCFCILNDDLSYRLKSSLPLFSIWSRSLVLVPAHPCSRTTPVHYLTSSSLLPYPFPWAMCVEWIRVKLSVSAASPLVSTSAIFSKIILAAVTLP